MLDSRPKSLWVSLGDSDKDALIVFTVKSRHILRRKRASQKTWLELQFSKIKLITQSNEALKSPQVETSSLKLQTPSLAVLINI